MAANSGEQKESGGGKILDNLLRRIAVAVAVDTDVDPEKTIPTKRAAKNSDSTLPAGTFQKAAQDADRDISCDVPHSVPKSKIYSKKGDDGKTSLLEGKRVSKASAVCHLLGEVQELNAMIGCLETKDLKPLVEEGGRNITELAPLLQEIQSGLFDLGAYISAPSAMRNEKDYALIDHLNPAERKDNILLKPHKMEFTAGAILEKMEDAIDKMDFLTGPLKNFILPKGFFHLAVTVCRRAERSLVSYDRSLVREAEQESNLCPADVDGACRIRRATRRPNHDSLQYLNRLSDFLFALARYHNWCGGAPEIAYRKLRSETSQ